MESISGKQNEYVYVTSTEISNAHKDTRILTSSNRLSSCHHNDVCIVSEDHDKLFLVYSSGLQLIDACILIPISICYFSPFPSSMLIKHYQEGG